jgi:hypothetical protein
MRALATILALLVAAPAIGRSTQPAERAGQGDHADKDRKRDSAPLSAEDAALVRELALLERVELLKNLELFEPVAKRPPVKR